MNPPMHIHEMDDFIQLVDLTANFQAIIAVTGAATALSVAGLTPRVGLGRALTVGLRGLLRVANPISVRKGEIAKLNSKLDTLQKGKYIVVIGGKGNGKSCLIDSCLHRRRGVITTTTESGASKGTIVDSVLKALTGIKWRTYDVTDDAKRVLFFYNIIFMRSKAPIVVIRVPVRMKGEAYASLTGAVRELADEYGLRVVVDGTPNSIPPGLLTTLRQDVLSVEPMARELIESIPEFSGFIQVLKRLQLDDAAWAVLGGCPMRYMNLNEVILNNFEDAAVVEAVKNHLVADVLKVALHVLVESSPDTKALVEVFRERNVLHLPMSVVSTLGLLPEYHNKVFRKVGDFVVPATSAVEWIIRENIRAEVEVPVVFSKLYVSCNQSCAKSRS